MRGASPHPTGGSTATTRPRARVCTPWASRHSWGGRRWGWGGGPCGPRRGGGAHAPDTGRKAGRDAGSGALGTQGSRSVVTGATRSRPTWAAAGVRVPTTQATTRRHAGAHATPTQASPSVSRAVCAQGRGSSCVGTTRHRSSTWHALTGSGGHAYSLTSRPGWAARSSPGHTVSCSVWMSHAVARIDWPSAQARRAPAHRAGSGAKAQEGVPYVKATLRPHARHQAWR